MSGRFLGLLFSVLAVYLIGSGSLYIVDEKEQGVLLRFGKAE